MCKFFILWRWEKSEVEAIANVFWITLAGRGWSMSWPCLCVILMSLLTLFLPLSTWGSTCCLGACFRTKPRSLRDLQGRTNNRPVYALKANLFPPTFSKSGGKSVFLCLLKGSGLSCCFSPTWEALSSPRAGKQTGGGGRDGISSWPRWDHASFKMQIDTWRSKVFSLIPWAGGENQSQFICKYKGQRCTIWKGLGSSRKDENLGGKISHWKAVFQEDCGEEMSSHLCICSALKRCSVSW